MFNNKAEELENLADYEVSDAQMSMKSKTNMEALIYRICFVLLYIKLLNLVVLLWK